MPLSQKKRQKMEIARRHEEVNVRSLNGKGYFMDAYDDSNARKYLETGDPAILARLPDYREIRKAYQ